MGIKHSIMKNFIMRFGVPRVKRMMEKQRTIQEMPGALQPTLKSPTRFEIPLEAMKLMQEDNFEMMQMFPIRRLLSIMKNIHLSVDSISNNPVKSLTDAPPEFLEQLKEFALTLGIGVLDFVKLPHDLIFDQFGVVFDNAIILAMEMSKEKIDKAPSQETLNMVFGTYDELGKAANKISEFLRAHGYASQADHPLGGLVLFPPLAQKAGIGWVGKHGVLITPEFGSRVRLAAVYTSISNLPFADSNNHAWIEDYCKKCRICIKQCPPQAILEESVTHDTGRVTNIKQQDCFRYFAQFYGCSVCVKVCPFSKTAAAYKRLKVGIERNG